MTVMAADPLAMVQIGNAAGFDALGLRIVPPHPGDTTVPVVGDQAVGGALRVGLAVTGMPFLDIEANLARAAHQG